MAADVIVIGRGLLGAVVARRLADAGRAVLMVEGGRGVSEPPGSHVRNAPARQADPDGYFGAIDAYFDYLDPAAAPSQLPGAFTTKINGGLGIVWTNNCPRSVPGVDRPEVMENAEWDRCYRLAEQYLQVCSTVVKGSHRQQTIRERLAAPLAAQGREVGDLGFAGTVEADGQTHYVGPADILGDDRGGVESGIAPGIEVRHGSVTSIQREGGRVLGVEVDGERLRADHVVLAAGAIQTPLLLRRSGFDHAALGRYLSYHPVLIAQVVLDADLCAPAHETESDLPPRLAIPPSRQRPWHTMLLRDTNPLPVSADDGDVAENCLMEIQVFAPVEPGPQHTMSGEETTSLHFDVALGVQDKQRMNEIERDVGELCGRLGRYRAGCTPQWAPLGTPHLMGSTRVGLANDDTSVADVDGRVWGTENLYLATNGTIPNRLAVNPTLTAAALAMRSVDQILAT